MSISGFTPTTALPGLVPGGTTTLAGSNGLLPAQGGTVPSSAMLAAQAGVGEKPGIGTRLLSAMRAAIGELRGVPVQTGAQPVALQAQPPVTLAKQAAPAPGAKRVKSARTWTDKEGNLRQVGTGKVLKPGGAQVAPTARAAQPAAQPVATNATQLPNATVYSYDANGNPVAAPTMQQLGVTPTMLQGLTGMTGMVDPDGAQGPQVNATNQTNIGGVGSGIGLGSAVPVLGQPILAAPVTSPGDTGAPATPHNGASGGTQAVTNRNATDVNNRNEGLGLGYGAWGDPTGGIATPYSPYGSSMTGAYVGGQQNRGFFSRLLGL